MDSEGREQVRAALKKGKDEGKKPSDALKALRQLGKDEGMASDSVDAALESAGKKAGRCLKEKKGEPATDGDDAEVVLAQEDAQDVAEEVVEKLEEGLSEGEKEALVARAKALGKPDDVVAKLRELAKDLDPEAAKKVADLVKEVTGGKPERQ